MCIWKFSVNRLLTKTVTRMSERKGCTESNNKEEIKLIKESIQLQTGNFVPSQLLRVGTFWVKCVFCDILQAYLLKPCTSLPKINH